MSEGHASDRRRLTAPPDDHVLAQAGTLAGGLPAVSPQLSGPDICKALQRLIGPEIDEALRHRIFPAAWWPGFAGYAVAGDAARERAEMAGKPIVAEADPDLVRACLKDAFDEQLRWRAEAALAEAVPLFSAKRRLSDRQIVALGAAALVLVLLAILAPRWTMAILATMSAVFFLAVIGLRLLSLTSPPRSARRMMQLGDAELPLYTVLVPLFRETSILRQIIGALLKLDYPRHRLDIKLVLEETDIAMRRRCAELRLPQHFEIITVPAFGPQTKPKALNYALNFARGDLLTIFDAEDIPDPGQLKLAAATFAASPPQLACLQAQLTFYDAERNWLTRQFTAEYASLFNLMLPMLANLDLPLPLGGTSNHFRTSILRRIGGWDPYNVTEDADLGIRLRRWGYWADVIASETREEPNGKPWNWIRQRARWLKGWLQTWLVHMREPVRLYHELGWHGFWALQALVGGIVASALLHPVLLVTTLLSLIVPGAFPIYPNGSTALFGAAGLTVLLLGYGVSIGAAAKGLRRQGFTGWGSTLATMPLYWLMISIAAWLALWQFIRNPHGWNKTEHGEEATQRKSPRTRGLLNC